MFARFRRNRKEPSGQIVLTGSLSSRPTSQRAPRLAARRVGTTPEDRVLLAQLLLSPPAWDNPLPSAATLRDMGSQFAQPGPAPYLPAQGGDDLSKGGALWDASELR